MRLYTTLRGAEICIDLDPRNSLAAKQHSLRWFHTLWDLPMTLRNGTVMTKKDCYLAVIDCDPHDSRAYYRLGLTMSADEEVTLRNGTVMTKKDCNLASIDLDPQQLNIYDNLVSYDCLAMTVRHHEVLALTVVSTSDCYRSSQLGCLASS